MEGKAVLDNLLGDEQSLTEGAKMLKSDLEGLNGKMVSKQNEIDFLFAKVAELKSGKRICPLSTEKDDGESHQENMKLSHDHDIEPERLAETLLIDDMWRDIFAKVNDGQDLLNASRACQHFHSILNPLKNNFLFGKIIPFLLLHLNLNDVLKCRLVCRDWRSAITSFLDERTKISMLDFPSYSYLHPFSKIAFRIMKNYTFAISLDAKPNDANQFLQQFTSSIRNPLVTNSIALMVGHSYHGFSEILQYRKGISTILETFGRHIHHLDCSIENRIDPGAVDLLRDLFSKAVNLQTLVVSGYSNYVAKLEFEDITDSLPNLKTLAYKIPGESPIPTWLSRNFHLQITKLQLESFEGLLVASEFTWPEVTELCLESSYMCEAKDHLKCFEYFPSLKKLCVSVYDSTLPNILHIIQLIPAICPSFHVLQLDLNLSQTERFNQEEINLIAPRELDTLELNVYSDGAWTPYSDLTFLVCFPFIRRLSIVCQLNCFRSWEVWHRLKGDKVEILELLKYLATNSNSRFSNVWRMLPNLETLQLQNKVYKRPQTLHPKIE